MNYKKYFSQKLKEYRKENNLTQDDLAEILGYSNKNIAKWEQCFTLPPVDVLITLSKKSGISIDDLLGLNEKSIFDKFVDYNLASNGWVGKKIKTNNEIITAEKYMAKKVCETMAGIAQIYIHNQMPYSDQFIFDEYPNMETMDSKEYLKQRESYLCKMVPNSEAIEFLDDVYRILEYDTEFLQENNYITLFNNTLNIISKDCFIECVDAYERLIMTKLKKHISKLQELTDKQNPQNDLCEAEENIVDLTDEYENAMLDQEYEEICQFEIKDEKRSVDNCEKLLLDIEKYKQKFKIK